jgi:hypothetical protein
MRFAHRPLLALFRQKTGPRNSKSPAFLAELERASVDESCMFERRGDGNAHHAVTLLDRLLEKAYCA